MRFHGLDLNLLVTLDVLLVERNLTRASDRLNLTQPAVSNALTKLREHFDDDLLVRHGREMQRTPFAQQLFKPLQETLKQLRGVATARPRFDPLTAARTYQVVASDFVMTIFLGELILHLERFAPNVKLDHLPLNDDSIGKITRGEVDAIIWPFNPMALPVHVLRNLFTENFICIASKLNEGVGPVVKAEELFALKRLVPPYKTYWPNVRLEREVTGAVVPMPFSAMPWFVAKSDYVAMVPERLVIMYEQFLPLKRVRLETPLPPVAFSVQCHPDALGDPFKVWMLDQMERVAQTKCNTEQLKSARLKFSRAAND
jgi:LysR family transcriptional regulator, nod-box dependent transcriptional activator